MSLPLPLQIPKPIILPALHFICQQMIFISEGGNASELHLVMLRGGSRILGKEGSDKYIHNWGRVRGGRAPSRDSKGVWGSADSSPSGVWGEAPAAFLLLRLFSLKFTVISNTYTSRDIRITRACMDSDEKTVHSSQCYGSYCSAIKFVTQSFCEFVTEACTWPSKHQLYVGL